MRFDPERSEVRIEARSSIHPIDAVTHGLEGFLEAELDEGGVLDLSVAAHGASRASGRSPDVGQCAL